MRPYGRDEWLALANVSGRPLPVEFWYDEESRNWAFRVGELRIVGRGQETLKEARLAAAEAIAYALEDPAVAVC